MDKPYVEDGDIRIFSPDVFDYELEWHVDFEDRIVKIIDTSGWKIQFDNQIPQELTKNQKIFIKKMTWHRIIRGDGQLVVQITKLS